MRYFIIMVLCLTLACQAYAHPLSGRDKNNIKSELIKERKIYDACLEKASEDEDAKTKCGQDYALQRLFSVEDLFHLYTEHVIAAEDIYTELHIAVEGTVHRVGKSGLGYPEIILAIDAFGLTGVRCEFPKDRAEEIAQVKAGTKVTIGGISKGLLTDDYVRITHCEFLK